MAIKLIANYAKRLGLPGYSSHQFSVSCETELTDLSQVSDEATRLYGLLQESVDREIQQTGFVPDDDYGLLPPPHASTSGNGRRHGHNGNGNGNGNGVHQNGAISRRNTAPMNGHGSWRCSDKQRRLLTDLCRELRLSEDDLDERSQHLFQRPVRQLNKLSASGLITDLLEEAESFRQPHGKGNSSAAASYAGGAA
jgi:hypothetical protein